MSAFLASVASYALMSKGGSPVPDYYYDKAFTNTIVGAWGMRHLVHAYTGPIIRVKDSTDVELDVYPDENGDLEAWSLTGDVSLIVLYDQSGNGAHLTPPTAAAAPLVVLGASPMGRAVARFDGVTSWMYDAVSATDRPYMIHRATTIWFGGGRGPRAENAIIWCVPARGAATGDPFQRWSLAWVAGTAPGNRYENGKNREFNRADLSNLASHSGWGGLASCVDHNGTFESASTQIPAFLSSAGVEYPLATRLHLGADATGVGKWGHDFCEIVTLDGAPATSTLLKEKIDLMHSHILG